MQFLGRSLFRRHEHRHCSPLNQKIPAKVGEGQAMPKNKGGNMSELEQVVEKIDRQFEEILEAIEGINGELRKTIQEELRYLGSGLNGGGSDGD
jgi:flagellar motor switch protein FliG